MRPRDVSKRRWKARCRLGREIPLEAIANHRLTRWFKFEAVSFFREYYRATSKV